MNIGGEIIKQELLSLIESRESINWSFHDVKKALHMQKKK